MASEREITLKASRSFDILMKAIRGFRDYLKEETSPEATIYYQARNLLKEGAALMEESVREAKKLMGPVPAYAPKELEARRAKTLEDGGLSVHGETLDEVRTQLEEDEFIKALMSGQDVDAYVRARFESQKTGKRKLANFKARLILDKLALLVAEGRRLQQETQKKRQGMT
jgi:hypothetical protein